MRAAPRVDNVLGKPEKHRGEKNRANGITWETRRKKRGGPIMRKTGYKKPHRGD